MDKKVLGKTRIVKKWIWLKRLNGRWKFMEFAYVIQRCVTHEYSGMINSCESGTATWLDWVDEDWTDKQRTFLYCDCKNELTASGSFVSDDTEIDIKNNIYGVKYKCTDCGSISIWNFDVAPVAVRVNSLLL